MKLRLLTILLLIICFRIFADITITPDKYEVTTGDKLRLVFELTYPVNSNVDISGIKNYSTDDLELLSSHEKSKKELDGIVIQSIVNDYIVFAEKGDMLIPPIDFAYVNNSKTENFKTDSLVIVIHSVLKGNMAYIDSTGKQKTIPLDSLKMILPIKDIGEYKLSATEKKYITAFILLLVFIAVFVYIFVKRKRKFSNGTEEKEKIIKIPAHITAFKKLDELKQKDYLSKGNFKEFAAELSLITRLFLEDRYEFPGAELPTAELESKITEYISKDELLVGINKLLEITDYVKFAKFIPMEAELKGFLDFAYELVDKLKEDRENNNV